MIPSPVKFHLRSQGRGSELVLALRDKYVLFEVHRLTATSFKGLAPPYTVPAHREDFVPVCSLWGAPDLVEFCLLPSFLTRQFYLESLFLLAREGQAEETS